ncbi:MAG: hypothetical protein IJL66_01880 [Lachnospiraceae bacterium]|nr:hypothetical protein [Lachnospiraceae bacterium]
MEPKRQTLQIQSVVYHNEKEGLIRALRYAANAVQTARSAGYELPLVRYAWGDASDAPVFSEEELDALRTEFADDLELTYRFFGFNSGSAKGQTLLGLGCGCDFILIMNPDVILSPRTLIELLRPFEDPSIGMTEARQVPVEHHKQYDFQTLETSWATGACSMIPTMLFELVGGYDYETFFLYCDDVDLSWRVRLAGKKILYCPAAQVFHAKRLSGEAGWQAGRAERYYSAEAAILMACKWSEPTRARRLMHIFENSMDEDQRRAAAAVRRRMEEGRMPAPLDPEHRVATFRGDYYADNRFTV